MSSTTTLYHHAHEEIALKGSPFVMNLKFSIKNERKILKIILLERLNKLLYDQFYELLQYNQNNASMECYVMDNQIIRYLIQGIIETGDYTLEGIAYHTRIPLDVILDAACGNSSQFSITPWSKIVSLYLQVKPEIARMLYDKLFEIRNKNHSDLILLINDP